MNTVPPDAEKVMAAEEVETPGGVYLEIKAQNRTMRSKLEGCDYGFRSFVPFETKDE